MHPSMPCLILPVLSASELSNWDTFFFRVSKSLTFAKLEINLFRSFRYNFELASSFSKFAKFLLYVVVKAIPSRKAPRI